MVNAPVADPLLAGLTWHVADPLDLRAMAAAADALLGRARLPGLLPAGARDHADDPIHRRVIDARWTRLTGRPAGARTAGTSDLDAAGRDRRLLAPVVGDLLAFEIEANAFCHQMVRSLVGTLVDVGPGPQAPLGHPVHPAVGRPVPGRPAGPAPGAHPDGGPLRRLSGLPGRAPSDLLWEVAGSGPGRCSACGHAPGRPAHSRGPAPRRCPDTRAPPNKESPLRTYSPKPADITRAWHIVDADGLVLGRLATEVAAVLRGKHKPMFAPHVDTGDHVIVVNADKVVLTSGKAELKMSYRHCGYPGGLTATSYADLMIDRSDEVVRDAIRGMLPKNRLGPPDGHQAEGLPR